MPSPSPTVVRTWIDQVRMLRPDLDVAPLQRSLARPSRVLIAGRTGVGKTTLANRWCQAERATGLGGITDGVHETALEGTVVVDTPGIDRPESALLQLQPMQATTDVWVWVIDGLQPLTLGERQVIEQLDLRDILAIVGRADLLGEQLREVLARVRSHLGDRLRADPVGLDLRHDPLPERPLGPPRRAKREAAEFVRGVSAATRCPHPTQTAAATAVRTVVQELVRELEHEVRQGRLSQKVDARLALRELGPRALGEVWPTGTELPSLPLVSSGRRARVLGSMSGIEGALRLLRADAASWLADLQVALAEAYEEHPEWDLTARQHQAWDETTAALLQELDPDSAHLLEKGTGGTG